MCSGQAYEVQNQKACIFIFLAEDTHSPCPLLKLRRKCSRSFCASAADSSGGRRLRWVAPSSPGTVRLSCSLEPWWLAAIRPLALVLGDESASPETEAAELRRPVAGSPETVRALVPTRREDGWSTESWGGAIGACIERWASAKEGMELCVFTDDLREPEGVPGRDGVGVACLEVGRPDMRDSMVRVLGNGMQRLYARNSVYIFQFSLVLTEDG